MGPAVNAVDTEDELLGSKASDVLRRVVKRMFDVAVSSLALLMLSPLFLAVAVAIRLDSPGPAFFRQERVGLGGRPFRIWKFRSMALGNAERSAFVSPDHDPRITRVGASLRRSFIDELPQLINVLAGQMSLVGPRPETPYYVAYYTQEELGVLSMKPGMAGPSTLRYSAAEPALLAPRTDPERYYLDVLLHERVCLDLTYAERGSLVYDLRILLGTGRQCISGVLRREGSPKTSTD
jgi:lipopolysaccharide/colanic/teichoic acid biosynthesis glycosyltransferase